WQGAIYWLYQADDFSPTARYEKGQLHYTVTDQVGTITELMSETGYIDYRQKLSLWGEANIDGHRHHGANDPAALRCAHRFAGQYYDEESELHYNRFRYYSPETGQYLSHDPIGLLGGFNPYGYVFDPTGWVDPLGLAGCWASARKKYWKNEALANPHKYSPNNLARMAQGKAPRIKVEVFNPKTLRTEVRDVSMELHHKYLPQRSGSSLSHEVWNLEPVTPWAHEAMDPFRHTGTQLIKILKGTISW
ncbi:TPA: RHS repeat-associated core domain-containing protein, partial [Pasteurella multocida]|nr:RHS repeat-associated core domain-containing protein [Pasteurella multocida]